MRNRSKTRADDRKQSDLPSAEETFLTEEELAARWRISPKTLRNARVSGRLLGFIKISHLVRYRLSEVIAFEEEHSLRSTSGGEE